MKTCDLVSQFKFQLLETIQFTGIKTATIFYIGQWPFHIIFFKILANLIKNELQSFNIQR